MRDAAYLDLAPFEVVEIFDSGAEFHVHLRVNRSTEELRPANYEQTRNSLLRRIQDEAAETSTKYQETRSALKSPGEANNRTDQLEATLAEANKRIHQLEETVQRLDAILSTKVG